MSKTAVIIYGPPGSGKGTQADLLARLRGFVHFDTGKFGERLLYDPGSKKNKSFQRERKNFEAGRLFTPSWTLKELVSKITKKIAGAGFNVVYSGSPRTLYEAFGDKKTPGLIDILEKEYGKKNIKPFYLKIDPNIATKRNVARLICSVCATPVLSFEKVRACPLCGGKLKKRILDNPETMKIRLEEYNNRTKPIVKELKKRGYKIIEINAAPRPYEVFEQIKKRLK